MGSGHSTIAQLEKQTVFQTKVYRIPALLYERDSKTLIAFAEQRKTPDDASGEKLVMKKAEVKETNSSGKTVEWSELRVVKEAHIDGYRPMNPCPVYDKVNKKLFLFFICVEDSVTEQWQIKWYCNKARLCYITSTDFGETWSGVTDLTDKLTEIKDWATFAVGPGHGIQTGGRRLIVPAYAYYSCCRTSCLCCSCKSNTLSLYSDDSGENWKFGEMFPTKSNECQMAEVYDDNGSSFIYCNARSDKCCRVDAFSENNGVTFSVIRCSKLKETGSSGCQGSVISFPAQKESANAERDPSPNKWLLFTHPTSKSSRTDLGVYLNKSPCDPKAWSEPTIINGGPSGYSDLACIDDGWFACLFECGQHEIYEQLAFVVFSYNDIKKNTGE
ncbi:sialidase-3-like [Archocentrus centrarchus]|uniref:sialidase-3-like n=1 Tax=Archocentrus centrarchus TaxID=63155 RepID=UPI0011EA530A|nr:sialidase-3-like [Archocentrus centrarchus]